ncbi:MAG: IS110 family transposase [Syntrophobacteraceae bacterium]
MFYIGCDVSEKSSYVYVTDGKGRKVESQEIPTDKDGYRQYFKRWMNKPVKVAVEAGGHSRWIHDTLKKLGISVYIVNPNKVKLIAKNKKKTDKVDAIFLAKLLRIDELPERVYMAEGDSRELRDLLRSRHQLLKSSTCLKNHLRGMLRQEGIKLKTKAFDDESIFTRLQENKSVPKHLNPIVESYGKAIAELRKQKDVLDDVIADYQNKDVALLKSVPGVGEVSSKTYYAAISTITRFKRAKQLTSYCGLVPSVFSSGERADYGHITREGRSEVRHVAVQSAHAILRSTNSESKPLRKWYERIARRRGNKTAVVALARKLIEIIFYVLRDRKPYDASLLRTN